MFPNKSAYSKDVDEKIFNLEFLINQRFSKMVDAEEQKDWWKYFVNFKFIYLRLSPHMLPERRREIAGDFEMLEVAIMEIEKTNENEESKKRKVSLIRRDFVDKHVAFLFDSLPDAGLASIQSDAEVDFTVADFKALKTITRMSGGLPAVNKIVLGETKEKQDEAMNSNTSEVEHG